MTSFVRQEIWPLEAIWPELGIDGLARALEPLQGRGQAARAVGRPPAAGARRPGAGPGSSRPHARDPRHLPDRAARVRQRGSRLGQLGDPGPRRERGTEGALAAPAAGRRPAQRLQHDRARHARVRSHPAAHQRPARRRRLGDRRAQVVHLERVDRRLPDRDGRHRPRRPPLAARLDVHRPGRHARGPDRARRAHDGAPVGGVRLLRGTLRSRLRGRPPARRGAARRPRARASSSPSTGSSPGASTTACAGSGWPAARST